MQRYFAIKLLERCHIRLMCSSQPAIVPARHLLELREGLRPGLPRSNSMRICIRNVVEGRVSGNFYTNGWPHFTTVVFQCLHPRLSDTADLFCYTNSKHHLLQVFEEHQLVTKGRWQKIVIVEDDENTTAEYLKSNLKIDGNYTLSPQDYHCVEIGTYALLDGFKCPKIPCPAGYSVGVLEEKHSQFIASQSDWLRELGRRDNIIHHYLQQCIKNLDNVAIFHDQDTTTPVAWHMNWAFDGSFGNLMTLKKHRKQGLAEITTTITSEKIIARNDIPETRMSDGNSSIRLATRIGFTHIGRVNTLLLHFN